MRWQWFKASMPVGEPIDITLNDGDVYIMSEKAVGADWKLSSKYTLRHAAGAGKYRSLSKWEKKRPAYEAKLKVKADAIALKEAKKAEKVAARTEKVAARTEKVAARTEKAAARTEKAAARIALKTFKVETKARKKEEVIARKKVKADAKETKVLKRMDPEKLLQVGRKVALREYKNALKKHDWEDNDASFYRWVAIEAGHSCSPNCDFFKEFQTIWTSKDLKNFEEMNMDVWELKRGFYRNLCAYKCVW